MATRDPDEAFNIELTPEELSMPGHGPLSRNLSSTINMHSISEQLTIDGVIQELAHGIDAERGPIQEQILSMIGHARALGEVDESIRIQGEALQIQLHHFLYLKRQMILHERAVAPVLSNLASSNVHAESVREIANLDRAAQRRSIPVLLDWYARDTESSVHGDIRDVLTMPWAGTAPVATFLAEFRNLSAESGRGGPERDFAFYSAAKRATSRWYADFFDIASDPSEDHFVRRHAIEALGRFSRYKETSIPVLMTFLATDDWVLYIPAAEALARWHVTEARPRILELLEKDKSQSWLVRQLGLAARKLSPGRRAM